MKKISKEEISQEVFDLYDDYAHNRIDRRKFMDNLSLYAVGGLTVSALLQYIMPNYKQNVQVPEDDPRLNSEYITYNSKKGGGDIKGLLSIPKNLDNKLPGVLVVHENRGLNPYIEDVTRRAALAGFVSLGPDMLSPLGGYPGNDDEGRAMQKKRDRSEMLEDFIAAFHYIRTHPQCTGRVGVVGFCFGGWISNMLAVKVPELGAAVPYYGRQPSDDMVASIQAPLLIHYGELDTRVNAGWPAYEAELKKQSKQHEAFIYAGANHGFHNDTTPRYDKESAELSWQRTLDFFEKELNA